MTVTRLKNPAVTAGIASGKLSHSRTAVSSSAHSDYPNLPHLPYHQTEPFTCFLRFLDDLDCRPAK
ncbi:hypothetical protein NOG67_13630 [Erwinia persicina]|uniref:hypothetical protein n=1 Tax=Erwinia persicina TaxID=55211 RepID=UPI00210556BC|nr:hypothetical protein [Erwinia persicina]MCQ4105225.1 hypothetical protein [Erwinia persicina]UTX11435.1 hypothetical protein NOG67_13630 [Erwinia persicina]